MKTYRIAALLPAIALLAACGGEAQEPAPTNDNPPALAESADEQPAGMETPEPADGPEAVAASEGAIPAEYVGVWDYIEGKCLDYSDMRLEISQDEFLFYEAVGEVQRVVATDDYIVVDLAMAGEGETWNDSFRLDIDADGLLHTSDPAAATGRSDYPRKRCDG